ncbi:MAG: 50S ribosomal protein L17 [Nitrospirae bacterium]|nr:50S ribosomal protein L17 [Nitrospirota bacterium]
MRHRVGGRKLRRPTAHRLAMLRNLTVSLLLHESVRVSVAKAKEVRRLAEKAITWGKQGHLHARRLAFSMLRSKPVTTKLFSELSQRYQTRAGGYTRILRIGSRRGDNSPQAILELVDRVPKTKPEKTENKQDEKTS